MKIDSYNNEELNLFLETYFAKNRELELESDVLREKLKILVQRLVDKDFSALVQVLYRIDVSEKKLKSILSNNPLERSTDILVDAIIERQKEKLRARDTFSHSADIPEDERW